MYDVCVCVCVCVYIYIYIYIYIYVQGLIKISGSDLTVGNILVRNFISGMLCRLLMTSVLVFRFDCRILLQKILLTVNQV